LRVKVTLVWVAIAIALLFVGTNIYRILHPPGWQVECTGISGAGTAVAPERMCFIEYSEVVTFVDDSSKKRKMMTCTATRIRQCE
jgi:hypothetical protein